MLNKLDDNASSSEMIADNSLSSRFYLVIVQIPRPEQVDYSLIVIVIQDDRWVRDDEENEMMKLDGWNGWWNGMYASSN